MGEGGRARHGAQKGWGRAEVAGDRTVVGASTAGDCGREVGDELIGGVGGTEREAGACARGRRRQAWPTGQQEGEGERARGLAPTGGARLSGTKGARACSQARLNGPTGLKWFFYFLGNF